MLLHNIFAKFDNLQITLQRHTLRMKINQFRIWKFFTLLSFNPPMTIPKPDEIMTK